MAFLRYLLVGTLYIAPLALCAGMILKWGAGALEAGVRYPMKRFGVRRPSVVAHAWEKTLGSLWSRVNLKIGALEYAVGVPRNYTLGAGYAAVLLYLLARCLWQGEMTSQDASRMAVPAVVTLLSVVSHQRFIFASLKIAEFLRTNPRMAPGAFFAWYYQLLGPIPDRLPDPRSQETVDPAWVDFRRPSRSGRSNRLLLLRALWDTAHLAHICLRNLKYLGPESAREIFDCMAALWGKRSLETLGASFRIEGAEKIQALSGSILLSMNHKSHMDFVLTFFALCGVRRPSGRGIRPRFVTAKDHFVDNIIVYEFLGVGRLIETVDMVFIERRKVGKGQDTLSQAARFAAEKEIEIAIFPQGTRALPHLDGAGRRLDAGYYTTCPPKGAREERGHLRKGLAYLALDTALRQAELGRQAPVHIVNIGIEGTSSMACKGSTKLQTGVEVVFRVGEIQHITPEEVRGLRKPEGAARAPGEKRYLQRVNEIHARVDEALAAVSRIREGLAERFLAGLRDRLGVAPQRLEEVRWRVEASARASDVLFHTVDRLDACPEPCWDPWLELLARKLEEGAPQEIWRGMRDEVSGVLLQNLRLKQHGKKVRRRAARPGGRRRAGNPAPSLPGLPGRRTGLPDGEDVAGPGPFQVGDPAPAGARAPGPDAAPLGGLPRGRRTDEP